MKCIKAQDLFSAYMENAMEQPLRVVFEQHLAECPQCSADYEKFQASVMMLEELPDVEVPQGLHAAVMMRVERERLPVPPSVKWWDLDWQKAFTIRVPARAAALGFAVLLMMVMAFRLTPASTVVADWFGIPRAVGKSVGNEPADAPKLTDKKSDYEMADSGLSIRVEPRTGGTYLLHVAALEKQPICFSVYKLSDNVARASGTESAYQTGFVRQGEHSVTRIDVSSATGAGVVEMTWRYNDRNYSRFIFLPSNFNADASAKNLQLAINDMSIYDALKLISRSYGVVILAEGDLNRKISYAGTSFGAPEDALFKSMMQAKMTWQAVDSSIYTVEPGN